MSRYQLIKSGAIRPCQPTPLRKIAGEWRVVVPTYVDGVVTNL